MKSVDLEKIVIRLLLRTSTIARGMMVMLLLAVAWMLGPTWPMARAQRPDPVPPGPNRAEADQPPAPARRPAWSPADRPVDRRPGPPRDGDAGPRRDPRFRDDVRRGLGYGPRPALPPGPWRFPFGTRDPRYLEELRRNDPEMYELEVKDQELERKTFMMAQAYQRASEEQRPEMKKKLEQLVSEHFDVRQKRRQLHLDRLQEELEKLKKAIDAREDMRDQLVGRRVAELLGEEDDLDF